MPERDWTSQSMEVLCHHVCLTMPAQSFRELTLIRVSASPSLEMPLSVCDDDYLAAFSPHTTLGKLTHLFFCEDFTSQAGKFTVCSAQPLDVPLSPACLASLGQHTWMPV